MSAELKEAWILAGAIDGGVSHALLDDVAGMPYVLRLACDLALAGATRIVVVWSGVTAPPDLRAVAKDRRLATRAKLELHHGAPAGRDSDGVIVVRADRLYHRDIPGRVAALWQGSGELVKVRGDEHDAVIATDRRTAQLLAVRAHTRGWLAAVLARFAAVGRVIHAEVPYAGFTMPLQPARKAQAEWRLVWSLRKSADGVAAKLVNRRLSLPLTYLLARTRVHPNHVTLCALACALAGAVVIASGGYAAGLAGMLLVELGSIVDGIDGELARLRFQFSRTGQWLDTVVDDVSTVAYASAVTVHVADTGAAWAVPLGAVALLAFAITQGAQYALIRTVYRSGDLAAIPWAFQSAEQLSRRATGPVDWLRLTVPKLLKRDFAVTLFVVFALAGRLELLLLVFAAGALGFFVVFWVQTVRNRHAIHAAYCRTLR